MGFYIPQTSKLEEGDRMEKQTFIEGLAKSLSCSREQAEQYFSAMIQELKAMLMQGEALTIPGFGKFSVKKRPARTYRNPSNGQSIKVNAKAVPMFKPGDALKLHVNNALREENVNTDMR
jgi:DNA-binding protein HU-beta